MTVQPTDPADRLVRARAFADGEVPASPDGMRLGREIVRDLLAEVKEISRELHAYKRAKAENDERFQLQAAEALEALKESDGANTELAKACASLRGEVEQLQGQLDAIMAVRPLPTRPNATRITRAGAQGHALALADIRRALGWTPAEIGRDLEEGTDA